MEYSREESVGVKEIYLFLFLFTLSEFFFLNLIVYIYLGTLLLLININWSLCMCFFAIFAAFSNAKYHSGKGTWMFTFTLFIRLPL